MSGHHDDSEPSKETHLPWRRLAAPMAALLVVVAALVGFLSSGGGSGGSSLPGGARQSAPGSGYEGSLTLPVANAPPVHLRDYLGRPVTLAQFRGRAVLVTFLYSHCPDVCPLIAANLRLALQGLGPHASQAQLVAISVDPRGDTPAVVARFVKEHGLSGRMEYLIGSAGELARTWAVWHVGSRRDSAQPQLVAHDALVYGVSASGRLTTVYPSNFAPSQLVHDVPRLASH